MGLFITTRTTATRHAVYAEERANPILVQADGTGVVGLVGQFPWGPDDQIVTPTDPADRMLTFAPPGMDQQTSTGWLAVIKKPWPDLRIVRVLGSAAVKAQVQLTASAVNKVLVVAKYKGTAGNSINCIVAAPSDGDVNHFNLTVQVTGASGTTEDFFENLNYSGVGSDSTPDLTQARLVGAITKTAAGRPDNGTYPMTTGANGTINSARYLGTAGAPDFGLSLFENDPEVEIVFSDDPGNTERAAVNTGLVAHAALMGDRIAVIGGNSGLTVASVKTDVALNRSQWAAYDDGWFYEKDEVDGTERLTPGTSLLACVMANLSPSTSPAWKDPIVSDIMKGALGRLETNRGSAAGQMTAAGICTKIREIDGRYTYEAGVLTIAPSQPSKKRITRTRMAVYIARALTRAFRPSVDAPNVPSNQQDILLGTSRFMNQLVTNASTAPNTTPHVLAWGFDGLAQANPQAALDNGDFTVPLSVKTSAGMERIFLSFKIGETVTVTAQ